MHMEMVEEEDEVIERKINDKIDSIECTGKEALQDIKDILIRNKSLFSCLLYTSRCV